MSKQQEKFDLPHEKQIRDYYRTIDEFKRKNQGNPLFNTEIKKLEKKLERFKKDIYRKLTPWDRMMICRHPLRPHAIDYIENMFTDFAELHGDRTFADDHAVIGGFAKLDEEKFMVIGQEKGNDTDSRLYRNFGMMNPEGFRKALRLIKLAEKFSLPVVTLIDTAGAYPGLEAEERGQGWAIAQNLLQMSQVTTPIIVVVIGEGSSGGALGLGVGDRIGMLEHAYYSVISPEGCASILWKDTSKNVEATAALKLNSENLLHFKLIDEILDEPLGGAHHDREEVFDNVRTFIKSQWDELKLLSPKELTEKRYKKFRQMGKVSKGKGSL